MCIIILNVYLHQIYINSRSNGLGLLQFDMRSLFERCKTFDLRMSDIYFESA
jgi:hypothetical protein